MAKEYPPAFIREKVAGVKVVKDEVLASGLSYKKRQDGTTAGLIPVHSIRVLTLENGDKVHGCRWCPAEGTLGQVRQHLHASHGMAHGGAPRKDPGTLAADGAVPDRKLPYPSAEALGRTLWEYIDLAEKLDDYEDVITGQDNLIASLQEQLAAANQRAVAAEKALTAQKTKLKRLLGD